MTPHHLPLLLLVAPFALLLVGAVAVIRPETRSVAVVRAASTAGVISLAVGAFAAVLLSLHGPQQTPLLGWNELGFALRLDALSLIAFALVSLLATIVLRFSASYLDGEPQQSAFLGWMAATAASVQLLALSGNLLMLAVFWVLSTAAFRRLVVFYGDRPASQRAAVRQGWVATLGDVTLVGGLALLYSATGTGDLTILLSPSEGWAGPTLEAGFLLVLVAVALKSAQIPFQGWLLHVVEAPTPVSALLHAGLLNAGAIVLVRLSPLLDLTSIAPLAMVLWGGATALLASCMLMTHHSVKLSLATSSSAHMGFSLMLVGMGLYAAAMLHLVAHSFYKASAFLQAGGVLRASSVQGLAQAEAAPLQALAAVVLAGIVFMASAQWIPLDEGMLPLAILLVMGLAQLLFRSMARDAAPGTLIRSVGLAFAVSMSFLVLESAFAAMLGSTVPSPSAEAVHGATLVMLVAFGGVSLWQMLPPRQGAQVQRAIALHLRNGLYLPALSDRLLGIHRRQDRRRARTARRWQNVAPSPALRTRVD